MVVVPCSPRSESRSVFAATKAGAWPLEEASRKWALVAISKTICQQRFLFCAYWQKADGTCQRSGVLQLLQNTKKGPTQVLLCCNLHQPPRKPFGTLRWSWHHHRELLVDAVVVEEAFPPCWLVRVSQWPIQRSQGHRERTTRR